MDNAKSFEARLARIFEASGASNDNALARILDIKGPSVYAARKRQQIPSGWVEKISDIFNVSSDWLYFGTGPKYRNQNIGSSTASIDRQMLFDVVETLEEVLNEMGKVVEPSKKAEVVCLLYEAMTEDAEVAKKPATILRLIRGALAANE